MYNAVIQQIDEPMEVYDNPVNRFVAGFLGTPPMNFFNGMVEMKDSKVCFVTVNDTIAIPNSLKEFVSAYNGKEMVLGIRPENISPNPYPGQSENAIFATVQVVEPLGDRMDVYLDTIQGSRFIANIDPHIAIKTGESVLMHIDIEKIHIFEIGDTGRNISLKNNI